MRIPILGLEVSRKKDIGAYSSVPSGRSWFPLIRESFTGAFQRNIELSVPDALSAGPVFVCIKLISSDIAKMEVRLIQDVGDDIWEPTTNPAYTPVLRRPNHYQNRISFVQSWITSKLIYGNTYVLKARDNRGVVDALYVLDPECVRTLVAANGDVYYELSPSDLAGVGATVRVPAREIIHDRWNELPSNQLVGRSPLIACMVAISQGVKIRRQSAMFFDNQSTPSGILVAPHAISNETAQRLEDHWNANYGGPDNVGKIAALGDGLTFVPLTMSAKDSQSSEQLKESAIEVCNAFGMPPWVAGYGPEPNYNNGEAKYQAYYQQCLQILIEALELCLDEGLSLPPHIGIQCDISSLIRMDSAAQMEMLTKGVRGGIYTPNEGRKALNKKPIEGGDTVYLQQQDHSLEYLSTVDQRAIDDPTFGVTPPAVQPQPVSVPAADKGMDADDDDDEAMTQVFEALLMKELAA